MLLWFIVTMSWLMEMLQLENWSQENWHLIRCYIFISICCQHTVCTYCTYRAPHHGLYPTNPVATGNSTLPQYLERQYLPQHEAETNTNLMRPVWNLTLIDAKPRSVGSACGDQQNYRCPGSVLQPAGFGPLKKTCEPESDRRRFCFYIAVREE